MVLAPEAPCELDGDVPQVVFPTGWVLDEATGEVMVYYGASDTVVAMARATLSDLLSAVKGVI